MNGRERKPFKPQKTIIISLRGKSSGDFRRNMANDLIIPFGEERGISAYNAFDALAQTNPEIAALAWANRDGVLRTEIMPHITRFRELKTTDRANLLSYMADVIRTNANVEMNYDNNRTALGITKLREDGENDRTRIQDKGETSRAIIHEAGATRRVELQEHGATARTDIECRAAVSINKMKYEAARIAIEEQGRTQRYLSDNQLKATYIEAQALQKALKIQALVELSKSRDQKMAIIKKAEFEYLAKVKEAELLRASEDQRISGDVAKAYLAVQSRMYKLYLEHEFGVQQMRAEIDKQVHKSDEEMVKEALRAITQGNLERIIIEIQSTYGDKKIIVKAQNGKQ